MKTFTQCSLPQIGVSLDGNDFSAELQYVCKADLQYLCNDKLKLLHALFGGGWISTTNKIKWTI